MSDLTRFLSEAQDVVAWGHEAAYFSLEGYACAVYGSFENFLAEISRLHFGGSFCFEGASRPGGPRLMQLSCSSKAGGAPFGRQAGRASAVTSTRSPGAGSVRR